MKQRLPRLIQFTNSLKITANIQIHSTPSITKTGKGIDIHTHHIKLFINTVFRNAS
ncbi:hypothetical protein TERTU_1694 [Teredinibacter turnerae T7901]|uniref:Uncharacterized protein n=1 Tax=Teredinibacter turnerae (strain ATCC 39867 / T7901) TaxID=377629 RepID=C5BU36_TERTT|nr:hypothetical protein TERTU_1694 [Teredinibacter turnerae T7901]